MEKIEWRSRMTRNPGNCCWCGIYCCQRDASDTCGGLHCTKKVAGVHEVAARLFLIAVEGKCAEEQERRTNCGIDHCNRNITTPMSIWMNKITNNEMDDMKGPQYVVTVERDTSDPHAPDPRQIVWEQYLDHGAASFESVMAYAKGLGDKYGKARVARLEFLDETDPGEDCSSVRARKC